MGMGHLAVFGLSRRGERLSCGEEALMVGAALGLRPCARAAAWALQRGLMSLPALACTLEDKFSCIVENRMTVPCSTAWHAAGGHGHATWCLTHHLPQCCCSNAFTKTCFSAPASQIPPHGPQHRLEQPAQRHVGAGEAAGTRACASKVFVSFGLTGTKPGIVSVFQPLLIVTLAEQRLALAAVAEGGKPLMGQPGAAGCRQGMVSFTRCNFFQW